MKLSTKLNLVSFILAPVSILVVFWSSLACMVLSGDLVPIFIAVFFSVAPAFLLLWGIRTFITAERRRAQLEEKFPDHEID